MAYNPTEKTDRRPIVCGTDFSATAIEAVDIAAAIARRLGTNLVLVHVDEFYGMAAADSRLFEAAVTHKRGELDRAAGRLRELGTDVDEKLLRGSAFDELVSVTTESKGRLVIVGAVGHGLSRRLLVGSVAERTAEASPVPTLVVRPRSRLGSWLRGEHPLKVLVGYDFSTAGDAALHWLNEIQNIGICQIEVLHIDWPPEAAHRLKYQGALPLTENPREIQKVLEQELRERVAKFLSLDSVRITVEPGWGRTEGYLFETASLHKVDLLVVGTHGRHGFSRLRFGSVSRDVLRHATVPVAVVPPAQDAVRK
jgi:nucleotide-binding universal stress UspA family protein